MVEMVYVEWEDAQSIDDWTQIEDLSADLALVKTLGYLLKRTAKSIVVSVAWTPETKQSCCNLVIPKGCILKIKHVMIHD